MAVSSHTAVQPDFFSIASIEAKRVSLLSDARWLKEYKHTGLSGTTGMKKCPEPDEHGKLPANSLIPVSAEGRKMIPYKSKSGRTKWVPADAALSPKSINEVKFVYQVVSPTSYKTPGVHCGEIMIKTELTKISTGWFSSEYKYDWGTPSYERFDDRKRYDEVIKPWNLDFWSVAGSWEVAKATLEDRIDFDKGFEKVRFAPEDGGVQDEYSFYGVQAHGTHANQTLVVSARGRESDLQYVYIYDQHGKPLCHGQINQKATNMEVSQRLVKKIVCS